MLRVKIFGDAGAKAEAWVKNEAMINDDAFMVNLYIEIIFRCLGSWWWLADDDV
jgi:hypothetical protein